MKMYIVYQPEFPRNLTEEFEDYEEAWNMAQANSMGDSVYALAEQDEDEYEILSLFFLGIEYIS